MTTTTAEEPEEDDKDVEIGDRNGGKQNGIVKATISTEMELSCDETTKRGVDWPRTKTGTIARRKCPESSEGRFLKYVFFKYF